MKWNNVYLQLRVCSPNFSSTVFSSTIPNVFRRRFQSPVLLHTRTSVPYVSRTCRRTCRNDVETMSCRFVEKKSLTCRLPRRSVFLTEKGGGVISTSVDVGVVPSGKRRSCRYPSVTRYVDILRSSLRGSPIVGSCVIWLRFEECYEFSRFLHLLTVNQKEFHTWTLQYRKDTNI